MSSEIALGIVLVAIGLVLCLRGGVAFRVLIALWGALAGFWLGAGLFAQAQNEVLLASPGGWIAAILAGLVLGILAWWFYVVAVLVAFGSFGFGLGVLVAEAFGASDGWTLTAGIAAAVLAVVIALVADLPDLILIILSVFLGAAMILRGAGALVDYAPLAEIGQAQHWTDAPVWVWALYGALIVTGLVVQLRHGRGTRGATTPARRHWQSA